MHHYRQALMRMRQGDSDRDIAKSSLMCRANAASLRTLAQTQGWLDPAGVLPDDATIAAALATPKRASTTVSSLEPLRDAIAAWHTQGVSGVVILAALKREHGYTGSYSAVRRMLATLKRETPPQATVRLDFAPGEAAQVDFGAGPMLADAAGVVRRTWAFVMTLCFSRHQYVEFVFDQTVATWLGCHRRAFEWFFGVPARVIIDNAKCAIIKACQNDPEVQRSYADCAEGYGFKIDPCPPHDPQKKGIVESGVKYVKGNFLPLKEFRNLADLNAQVKRWVMEEAGLRRHGTTGEAPLRRFEVERAVLAPLPAVAPDLGVWSQANVHRDCHVQFDRAFYSVPHTLVGQRLWLKASDGMVTLYADFSAVAAHGRASRPGERRTVRDHLPPNAQAFFAHDRAWCASQAARIGPACVELIERLLADRIVERLRAAQNVLRLAKSYPAARLEAACARALAHESPFYRTVKTILAGGHDLNDPAPVVTADTTHSGRFARDAASLFAAPATVQ
ncbi:MAG: IS21 family transposase [Zoogloea sp.]|nr:IS21 family transposase [Zoogloea sp.]